MFFQVGKCIHGITSRIAQWNAPLFSSQPGKELPEIRYGGNGTRQACQAYGHPP
jgi:hypothetical protein